MQRTDKLQFAEMLSQTDMHILENSVDIVDFRLYNSRNFLEKETTVC